MPELNEDLPQQETMGSVGGISPNLEALSAAGRGIEAAGSTISQAGSYVYRKAAQNEVSNVYYDIANAREKYSENLDNALRTGQLDTEQFAQQMKEDTDKIGANLETAEGRNFFERQQGRLQGYMLLRASHVAGQIAYGQTLDNFRAAGNANSNSAMMDPSHFGDIIDQNEEMINQAQATGSIQTPAQAEALRKELNTQVADGAAKGLAQMDPGKNPDGTPKQNLLLQTLDKLRDQPIDNHSLFKYLDADHVAGLEAYARRMDEVRAVQEDQLQANQDKLLRAKGITWMNQNSAAILSGKIDPKSIINNGNLNFEQKRMLVEQVRRQSMEEERIDPGYVNHVQNQIINGEVNSWDQLTDAYNANPKGMGSAYWKLGEMINKTPDGKIVNDNVKMLYKMGDQDLRFKGVGGAFTSAGDQANYSFRQELSAQANLFVQSGKGSLRDFYSNHNAKDPNSPIAILNKYRVGAGQRAQIGAQEFTQTMQGQPAPGVQYSTSPSGDIPPPQQPTPPPSGPQNMGQKFKTIEEYEKSKRKPQSIPSASAEPTTVELQEQRQAKESESQRAEDEKARLADEALDRKIEEGKKKRQVDLASEDFGGNG